MRAARIAPPPTASWRWRSTCAATGTTARPAATRAVLCDLQPPSSGQPSLSLQPDSNGYAFTYRVALSSAKESEGDSYLVLRNSSSSDRLDLNGASYKKFVLQCSRIKEKYFWNHLLFLKMSRHKIWCFCFIRNTNFKIILKETSLRLKVLISFFFCVWYIKYQGVWALSKTSHLVTSGTVLDRFSNNTVPSV